MNSRMTAIKLCLPMLLFVVQTLWQSTTIAQNIEQAPIKYLETKPDNAVEKLIDQLKDGEKKLGYKPGTGYLKDLLEELEVPTSSQSLVFSKTSLQRAKITARTPRALYFNDDVYVGYCQKGDVLEISVADPKLGTVFYALDQNEYPPEFKRHYDHCIVCHGGSQNHGYPGHLMRSLYADRGGEPVYRLGSDRVDHTTPFEKRWGGWYITGTHGEMSHRGNLTVSSMAKEPPMHNPAGMNVKDLETFFKTKYYLTPHSDMVAMMVLAHQSEGHNLITQLNFNTRIALHQQLEMNKILEEPTETVSAGTAKRIENAARSMVSYLLFCEEAPLKASIKGTSKFQEEFSKRGVKDSKGRHLREFDLKERLFKYPLSYLIYTASFDELPDAALKESYKILGETLYYPPQNEKYMHLDYKTRLALWEIVSETKKNNLPKNWGDYKPVK